MVRKFATFFSKSLPRVVCFFGLSNFFAIERREQGGVCDFAKNYPQTRGGSVVWFMVSQKVSHARGAIGSVVCDFTKNHLRVSCDHSSTIKVLQKVFRSRFRLLFDFTILPKITHKREVGVWLRCRISEREAVASFSF